MRQAIQYTDTFRKREYCWPGTISVPECPQLQPVLSAGSGTILPLAGLLRISWEYCRQIYIFKCQEKILDTYFLFGYYTHCA